MCLHPKSIKSQSCLFTKSRISMTTQTPYENLSTQFRCLGSTTTAGSSYLRITILFTALAIIRHEPFGLGLFATGTHSQRPHRDLCSFVLVASRLVYSTAARPRLCHELYTRRFAPRFFIHYVVSQ